MAGFCMLSRQVRHNQLLKDGEDMRNQLLIDTDKDFLRVDNLGNLKTHYLEDLGIKEGDDYLKVKKILENDGLVADIMPSMGTSLKHPSVEYPEISKYVSEEEDGIVVFRDTEARRLTVILKHDTNLKQWVLVYGSLE